jgi:uncharacterized protein YdhG (YjbR/CyaY superfamily)
MARYASVDDYLETLPEDRRAVMQHLRQAISDAAPLATETIAYDMPAFRLGGKFLVSFGAFKSHYSLFPCTQLMAHVIGDPLKPYMRGKGTLQFPVKDPIPLDLVRRIVEIRREEVSPGPGLLGVDATSG